MAAGQLGILAPIVVVAFVVTAIRQPRYALLTGTTLVITCFFNSVYPDGAIDRYYIGPALICWTWLAILGGSWTADWIAGDGTRRHGGSRRRLVAALRAVVCAVARARCCSSRPPSPLPARARAVDRTGDRAAQDWTAEVLVGARAERGRRLVVVLLDAPLVCHDRGRQAAGRLDHRRSDPPRLRPRRARPRDRPVPADAARLPDPERRLGAAVARRPVPARADRRPMAGNVLQRPADRRRRGPARVGTAAADLRGDPVTAVAVRRRTAGPAATGLARRRAAVVLLPGPQRGGEPRRARRRGARDPAGARRDVRDRRRQRRLEGRAPAGSPTTSSPRTPGSSGPSTTRRTSATAPRSGPGSAPRATSTSRSPTATASSRSRTSGG